MIDRSIPKDSKSRIDLTMAFFLTMEFLNENFKKKFLFHHHHHHYEWNHNPNQIIISKFRLTTNLFELEQTITTTSKFLILMMMENVSYFSHLFLPQFNMNIFFLNHYIIMRKISPLFFFPKIVWWWDDGHPLVYRIQKKQL